MVQSIEIGELDESSVQPSVWEKDSFYVHGEQARPRLNALLLWFGRPSAKHDKIGTTEQGRVVIVWGTLQLIFA